MWVEEQVADKMMLHYLWLHSYYAVRLLLDIMVVTANVALSC